MKYKLPNDVFNMIVRYVQPKYEEVDKVMAVLAKSAESEEHIFEKDEILTVLNYMVFKSYHEVNGILGTVFPLNPIEELQAEATEESPAASEPAAEEEVKDAPAEGSVDNV